MKQFSFIIIVVWFFSYFSMVSCDKEPEIIIVEEPDTIPEDTSSEIIGIYISTQDDVDKFNNLKYLSILKL